MAARLHPPYVVLQCATLRELPILVGKSIIRYTYGIAECTVLVLAVIPVKYNKKASSCLKIRNIKREEVIHTGTQRKWGDEVFKEYREEHKKRCAPRYTPCACKR